MNRIILMGRITADTEIKEGNGIKYCNFSIAVDRNKKMEQKLIQTFLTVQHLDKMQNL